MSAREVAFYGIVFGTLLLDISNAYAAINAAPSRSFAARRFSEMAAGALFLVIVSAFIFWVLAW